MNTYVSSEIGQLKTVLLHEPGMELENLTPKYLDDLLFDDIPWLPLAIKEHRAFAEELKKHGVNVVYLIDLIQEVIDQNETIKNQFLLQFIKEANIYSETLTSITFDYLKSFDDTKKMISKMIAGIKKTDLPNYTKHSLSDYIGDYPFVTDPIPNLYFTRDPFSMIGKGVALCKMFSKTRCRETIFGEYIFKYHPIYKLDNSFIYYDRDFPNSIEGGDILILNEKVLAVGISQRTEPNAIEKFAKKILFNDNNSYETILALNIPKYRTFMHLDTVFTQVDYDKFTIHPQCMNNIKVFTLTKNMTKQGKLLVTPLDDKLELILERYLGRKITLIPCGGTDVITSDREQWSDGANTFAIAPGEVIVYERNHITNNILIENGIKVYPIPSSELSRGRGGPRCMCMPLYRR